MCEMGVYLMTPNAYRMLKWHNKLPLHYQSLRGTSKVEAVHSVLDRTFYAQRGIGTEVFDARLGWWILAYNRRRMRALGRK